MLFSLLLLARRESVRCSRVTRGPWQGSAVTTLWALWIFPTFSSLAPSTGRSNFGALRWAFCPVWAAGSLGRRQCVKFDWGTTFVKLWPQFRSWRESFSYACQWGDRYFLRSKTKWQRVKWERVSGFEHSLFYLRGTTGMHFFFLPLIPFHICMWACGTLI